MILAEIKCEDIQVQRTLIQRQLEAETALKQKYVDLFAKGFLSRFDKAMNERLTGFSAHTSNRVIGAYVAHLVRRINVLKARLAQENLPRLKTLPQPAFGPLVLGGREVIPEIQNKISLETLYAVAWDRDSARLNTEMNGLQTWLKQTGMA